MKVDKIIFTRHETDQGSLVAIEELRDVPFQIRRVYYVYGTGNHVTRGCHAHKSLQQVLICIHGSCTVKLDDGNRQAAVTLEHPNEGLYISSGIWREVFDFSPDAVLLVLASENYRESDYIKDYDEFLRYVKSKDCADDEDSV